MCQGIKRAAPERQQRARKGKGSHPKREVGVYTKSLEMRSMASSDVKALNTLVQGLAWRCCSCVSRAGNKGEKERAKP